MGESESAGDADLLPQPVGERLRDARVKHGLELEDVASRTRIPLRHLQAIEDSDYSRLPSPTYAMGFAKSYARAVDVDEVRVGRDLRAELDTGYERAAPRVPYDVSDPDRMPSGSVAWIGAAVAVVLLIGVGIWYGTDWFRGDDGDTAEVASSAPASAPAPEPAAATTPSVPRTGGQVTLTATGEVWVRIYDADDDTLLMKTLAEGETYDVPQDASSPMINIGRPDAIKVTIDGAAVAPLGPAGRAVKDVGISADALRARASGDNSVSPSGA